MNRPSTILKNFLLKKLATLLLVTASIGAFATLGDGGKKGKRTEDSNLLPYSAKNFSLRSNYHYKSNNIFGAPEKKQFIILNPVITYQKGNAAYVMPLKKLPFMGKIKFSSTTR